MLLLGLRLSVRLLLLHPTCERSLLLAVVRLLLTAEQRLLLLRLAELGLQRLGGLLERVRLGLTELLVR